MNKSKNACSPTTLGAPLNTNQSRKLIFALSSLHFAECYPTLCIRAARGNLSVMRHYVCAKMCGRSSHPYIQYSRKHLQSAQCSEQSGGHQEHLGIIQTSTNILFIRFVH